jgi:hypothetical protein
VVAADQNLLPPNNSELSASRHEAAIRCSELFREQRW